MRHRIALARILRTGIVVTVLFATSCGTGETGASRTSEPTDKAAAIIVTLEDLPSSWREQAQASGGDDGSGSCLDSVIEAARAGGTGSTADSKSASFTQSDLGPFLIAMVTTPLDDVETSFDALRGRLAACDGTMDAAGFTTLIAPLTFPTIGNEAFAGKATATNPNGSMLSYLLAMARVDKTLVVAAHIVTLGELDAALVEGVMRAMVGRS